jgi:phosphatidylglycerophosphate synthase
MTAPQADPGTDNGRLRDSPRLPGAWVLVLDEPSADAERRVGGLSLALRLALSAEAGGAAAVVLTQGTAHLREGLLDPRLRLGLLDRVPPAHRSIRIPASYLTHPRLLATMAGSLSQMAGDSAWDLARQPYRLQGPQAFDPIDVVDPASAGRAEDALFETLRKPTDGWTARWLNRRISLRISRLLVRTPLRPNQVSLAVLAIGLVAAWLASRGTYAMALAGAGLFQTQSVLDGCDGEISRVTYRGSRLGEWLDTISDDLTNYLFFAGAGWGLYRAGGGDQYLLAGVGLLIGGLVTSAVQYRYLIRIGSGDLLRHPLAGREGEHALIGTIRPLFRRDTFILLTLVAAGLDQLGLAVMVAAAATVVLGVNAIRVDPIISPSAR